MTMRVFVCHAKPDIEATSEIVDLLETALELPAGALATSSLPGYSSDVRSEAELHSMLSDAAVLLALSTERSVVDTGVCFELGAAWALGIRIVPLLTGNTTIADLPWPLRGIPPVRPHDRAAWLALVQDLAEQLGVRVRAASEARIALDEIARSPSIQAPTEALDPIEQAPPPSSHSSAVFPAVRVESEESMQARTAQSSELGLQDHDAPRSSLPSCEQAFEAGRVLSECVFNRDADLDFAEELDGPFGHFMDALGGNWQNLRTLHDFDVWLGVTDNLLNGLPANQQQLSAWYELGYELATLHNIAGRAAMGSSHEQAEVEALWREALERFLGCAEALHISYEELARVLSLLENLIAPPSERDFANIALSLSELRRHAVHADRLHSAA